MKSIRRWARENRRLITTAWIGIGCVVFAALLGGLFQYIALHD